MVATSHCWNLPHPPSSTFSSFRSSWVLSFSQCLLETFQKFQDSSTNLLSALKGVEPKARKAWFISWRCLQIPGPHKKWWKWTLVSLVWVKTFKHGCWSFHGTFCSPGFTMCSKHSYQKKVCKANESFRRGVLGWPGGWEKRPWCLNYLGSVQFWQSLVPEKSQSFIELKLPKFISKNLKTGWWGRVHGYPRQNSYAPLCQRHFLMHHLLLAQRATSRPIKISHHFAK